MLLPKIFINKIFISSLWFRYIFLSFSYLYFYIINPLFNKNINIFLLNINKNIFDFGFKIIFSLRWLFDLKKFSFLNHGTFLLLYSNNYGNFINNENLVLYIVSFSSYFVNFHYLDKLFLINSFYKSNFFFFSKYNMHSILNIFKYVYLIFKILAIYFLMSRKILIYINKCLFLIKNTNKKNNSLC